MSTTELAPPVADLGADIPTEGLTIGQVAARTGLSIDTLRYYEKEGLTLSSPERSVSGQRRYYAADLRWIGSLVMLRRTGMPIRDIRRFVALSRVPDNESERLEMLEGHRLRVLQELREVQNHLAAIERKIAFYREKVDHA